VAAAGVPVNVCAGTVAPEHNVIGETGVMVGAGLTTTGIIC
jgi:hypothetical protein